MVDQVRRRERRGQRGAGVEHLGPADLSGGGAADRGGAGPAIGQRPAQARMGERRA